MELSIEQSERPARAPSISKNLPVNFVPRKKILKSIMNIILDKQHDVPNTKMVGLYGPGGFGKTTLAIELCKEERIIDAFHGILWVTLGQTPGPLVNKINNLIVQMGRTNPGFTDIEEATEYFVKLLDDSDFLFVIDDVWDESHLEPFLIGGEYCTRLITTREEKILSMRFERMR